MHNHNKDGGGKGMMWMMIPCLLLVGVLFLGGGKFSGGGYIWPVLIGVFVLVHVWMMFKGHGGHSNNTEEKTNDASVNGGSTDEHKHSGSCH